MRNIMSKVKFKHVFVHSMSHAYVQVDCCDLWRICVYIVDLLIVGTLQTTFCGYRIRLLFQLRSKMAVMKSKY